MIQVCYVISDSSKYGMSRYEKKHNMTIKKGDVSLELDNDEVQELLNTIKGKKEILSGGEEGNWHTVLHNQKNKKDDKLAQG
jgi:hypothetical protein